MQKLLSFILAIDLDGGAVLIEIHQSVAIASPQPLGPCPTTTDRSSTGSPNETQYINAAT